MGYIDLQLLFVGVGVRNFWLFLIVFVPISCFKLAFLRNAIMSCVEYFFKTTVDVQYLPVFVYYFLYVW